LSWTSRRYVGLLCGIALGAGVAIPGAPTWLRMTAAGAAAATLIVVALRWKAPARPGS